MIIEKYIFGLIVLLSEKKSQRKSQWGKKRRTKIWIGDSGAETRINEMIPVIFRRFSEDDEEAPAMPIILNHKHKVKPVPNVRSLLLID